MTPIFFSYKYLEGLKSTGFIVGRSDLRMGKFFVYRHIITGELVARSTSDLNASCFGYKVEPSDFSVALKTDGVLSHGKA